MRKRKRTPKIYTLCCPLTGEVRYVGKTHFSLTERLAKHLISFENNRRTQWIKSLGSQGMKPIIELVEVVEEGDWVSAEQYWIEQFRQWGFELLNIHPGGKGGVISPQCRKSQKRMLHTEKGKMHLKMMTAKSKLATSKKVLQFDKQGNFIQEFPSASEAAKSVNSHLSHITECCNEKPKRLSHKGFKWKYKVEDIV